ncbi:hypothetical protein LMG33818_001974 [Halomonadaceae bacterium LMG 33818]|uniref:acyltransferase family protein n=1 Tax=Cernens ardua TaxID=3402176 RepID=UPI003EDB7330
MLISVQALRALAAWIVVFHHFMQVFFNFHAHNTAEHLLSTRGQVGVDIFFIISGFVIYLSTTRRKQPMRIFFMDRIIRIAPTYWLFTLITAGIIYFAHHVMPVYGVSVTALLKSLFFVPSQNPAGFGFYPILPVGWTLNFEMMFYLLFSVSLIFPERYRPWLAVLLVCSLVGWAYQSEWVSNFYRQPVIYEFLLGIGLAIVFKKGWIPRLNGKWLLIPALIVVGCIAIILQSRDLNPYRFFTWGIPALVMIGALISMENLFVNIPVLKHMGDWSYSVYLVHIIVLWCAAYTLHQLLGFSPIETLIMSIPFIVLFSWLSFTFIEKGASRWLKNHLGLSTPRKERTTVKE